MAPTKTSGSTGRFWILCEAGNKLEDRDLQPGPIVAKAKDFYRDWAHSAASDM
jgi:hypothetical protein